MKHIDLRVIIYNKFLEEIVRIFITNRKENDLDSIQIKHTKEWIYQQVDCLEIRSNISFNKLFKRKGKNIPKSLAKYAAQRKRECMSILYIWFHFTKANILQNITLVRNIRRENT